jgi:predicted TIM-barrel enzyme
MRAIRIYHLQEAALTRLVSPTNSSLPYLRKVNPKTTASMPRIIGDLKHEINPFACNGAVDPFDSIDLAAATWRRFIRKS